MDQVQREINRWSPLFYLATLEAYLNERDESEEELVALFPLAALLGYNVAEYCSSFLTHNTNKTDLEERELESQTDRIRYTKLRLIGETSDHGPVLKYLFYGFVGAAAIICSQDLTLSAELEEFLLALGVFYLIQILARPLWKGTVIFQGNQLEEKYQEAINLIITL